MKLEYTDHYEKYGCDIRGSLVVVALSERSREIASGKPLEGFGSMSSFDAMDEAKAAIALQHSTYTVELGIPDLVVQVPADEWNAVVEASD